MEWARADYSDATYGTIGYWADGDFFKNHPLSGTPIADEIACVNLPHTIWSNVGYRLHEEIDGKFNLYVLLYFSFKAQWHASIGSGVTI